MSCMGYFLLIKKTMEDSARLILFSLLHSILIAVNWILYMRDYAIAKYIGIKKL